MLTYIARRLLQIVPLLIAISLIGFFVMQLAPGNYLDRLRMNPDISDQMVEELKEDYGLDQPLWKQYGLWLWRAVHLDFGQSFKWNVPVSHVIGTRLLNTLLLSSAAMVIGWMIAIPIGIHAATHKYQWSDNGATIFAFVGLSIPNFFFALLLQFIITRSGIDWPISGMTSMDYKWLSLGEKIIDVAKHLVIPAVVLGTAYIAGLMRQMRGQMLETLNEDYIKTARAKGLSERQVVYKHAFRNAVNPLITIFGFSISTLLSGAAITEIVTGWPGLGKMMLEAVMSRDIYLAQAGLMMSSLLLLVGNLIADILLAVVDPRIKYD